MIRVAADATVSISNATQFEIAQARLPKIAAKRSKKAYFKINLKSISEKANFRSEVESEMLNFPISTVWQKAARRHDHGLVCVSVCDLARRVGAGGGGPSRTTRQHRPPLCPAQWCGGMTANVSEFRPNLLF